MRKVKMRYRLVTSASEFALEYSLAHANWAKMEDGRLVLRSQDNAALILKSCGFASPLEVRRIANQYGRVYV